VPERFDIDGRELFLIDDFLAGPALRNFAEDLEHEPFVRGERDRSGGTDFVSWVRDYEPPQVRRQPYFRRIAEQLAACFPDESFELVRAYASALSYGDLSLAHRDCGAEARDVTAVLYLTPDWQRDWGGETIFFAEGGDARLAVSPRPGRLALFRGAIEHRGDPPTRACTRARLSMVFKFVATESGS